MELHELKNSAAHPYNKSNLSRPPTLLNRVPVGLLPLLSEPSTTTTPPPSKPPSKGGPKNTSTIDGTCRQGQSSCLSKPNPPAPSKANSGLASRFQFLPLLPVEDHSTGASQSGELTQSPINPQSPVNVPANRLEKKFHFLPLLSNEPALCPEPPSDDDHASPISTPSLTASSSLPSPPGTPSASSSPTHASSSLPPSDTDYFNLRRPPAKSNQKADQTNCTKVNSSFSKLTLEPQEKLENGGHIGRKGGKRCIVEYININGVDEPFYSYMDDDEPPSPVQKVDTAAGLLRPPNGFLPLYE